MENAAPAPTHSVTSTAGALTDGFTWTPSRRWNVLLAGLGVSVAAQWATLPVVAAALKEGNAYYSTSQLWDDGIIDPAKVTRSAIQNAASIAAMLLTTEACVTDEPEKDGGGPAMPDMGGMDMDMGGFDF